MADEETHGQVEHLALRKKDIGTIRLIRHGKDSSRMQTNRDTRTNHGLFHERDENPSVIGQRFPFFACRTGKDIESD